METENQKSHEFSILQIDKAKSNKLIPASIFLNDMI